MDVLVCAECGAWSEDEARGWAAFIGEDTEAQEFPSVHIFCRSCAAEEVGYRGRGADSEGGWA